VGQPTSEAEKHNTHQPLSGLQSCLEKAKYFLGYVKPVSDLLSSWALVLIGAIGAYIALGSLAAIRDQVESGYIAANAAKAGAEAAKTSADALVDAESAWVIVSNVLAPNFKPPSQVVVNEFRFVLKNCGRTVARLTGPYRHVFGLVKGGDELPADPSYGNPADVFGEREPPSDYGRLLAPRESNGEISSPCLILTDEDFESVCNRAARLFFYANFMYYDFVGRETELQFCYLYVPKSGSAPDRWALGGPKAYNRHTRRRHG
jgi:hypothetical protein